MEHFHFGSPWSAARPPQSYKADAVKTSIIEAIAAWTTWMLMRAMRQHRQCHGTSYTPAVLKNGGIRRVVEHERRDLKQGLGWGDSHHPPVLRCVLQMAPHRTRSTGYPLSIKVGVYLGSAKILQQIACHIPQLPVAG